MSTEATVVYRAIADFAALRKQVKGLRQEIRELKAEEEAYNASQAKATTPSKVFKDKAKAIKAEGEAYDKASKSVADYAQETVAAEKKKARQQKTTEELVEVIEDEVEATEDSTKASKDNTKAKKEQTKATEDTTQARKDELAVQREQAKQQKEEARLQREVLRVQREQRRAQEEAAKLQRQALRDQRAIQKAQEQIALAELRLRAEQERTARRQQEEEIRRQRAIVRELERTQRQRIRDADEAARQNRRLRNLPPIDPDGNLRGGTRRIAGSSNTAPPGSGPPKAPDPDPGGRNSRSIQRIFKFAKMAAGAVGSLFMMLGKLGLIAAIIGPGIAWLAAMTSAVLGVAGALTQMGGALLALPAIIGVTVVAIGTMVIALKGMMKVFQAYTQMKEQEAADAEAQAKAQKAAARQLRDAQRGLRDAREAQADSAESAARRVADAEKALIRAQKNVLKSQEALNKARKEALKDLINLREEVSRGALDEEAAVAALERAQEAYQNVLAEPGSSEADKLTALSDLHRAERDLQDIRQERTEKEAELAAAEKKGINGSERVLDAQENLKDSEEDLIDSKRNLKEAQEDQAKSARDSAERVADAQERLADAVEAVAEANSISSTAADAFQKALDKLAPSAQAFVLGLIGMRDAWTKLKKSVQEAFFKPLVGQLAGIRDALPEIEKNLVPVAKALGEVFASWIAWITSPEMRPFFRTLTSYTARIIKLLGGGFLEVMKGFVALIEAALPFVERFANTFVKSATGFKEWAEGARDSGKLAAIFEKAGQRTHEFWTVIKNLLGSFGNLLVAADDFNDWIMNGLVQGTQNFEDFTAAQRQENSPFKKYLEDIKPLLKETGELLKAFMKYIFGAASDPKNIKSAIDLLKQLRTELGPAIVDLMNAVRDANLLEKFIKMVTAMTQAFADFVEAGGGEGWTIILGFFEGLGKAFSFLIENSPEGVLSTISGILGGLAVMKFTGILGILSKLGKAHPAIAAALMLAGAGAGAVVGSGVLETKDDGSNLLNGPDKNLEPMIGPIPIPASVGEKEGEKAYKDAVKEGKTVAEAIEVSEKAKSDAQKKWDKKNRPLVRKTKQVPITGPFAGEIPMGPYPLDKNGREIGKRPTESVPLPPEQERTKLGKFVDMMKKLFSPDFIAMWDTIKTKWQSAMDRLGPRFEELWKQAKPLVTGLGITFIAIIKGATTVLRYTLGPALEIVISLVEAFVLGITQILWVLNKIAQGIVWFVRKVIEFFRWLYDELVGHSIIPDLINAIVDWFKRLPGMILNVLKAAGTWLLQKGKDLVQGLWNGAKATWALLSGWIGGLLGKALSALGAIGTFLFEAGKKLIQGLWNGIKFLWEGAKGIASWFADLPGKALSALGDLGGKLFNAGKSLIQGFRNGIEEVWNKLKSWLGTAVEKIGDVFKVPVRFLIETVMNDWIIGNINRIPGIDIPDVPLPKGFAQGDTVPGTGDGDTVPAMLTPGEFIIRKRSAKKLGTEKLRYMNATGELPGYAKGGFVQHFGLGDWVGSGYNKMKSGLDKARDLGQDALGLAGKGVKAGLGFVKDIARKGAAKALAGIFKPLRAILGKTPDFNGLPRGIANKAMDNVLAFVRGEEARDAAAQDFDDGAQGPAQLIGPVMAGDGAQSTERGKRAIEWMRNQSTSNNDAWWRMCLRAVRMALGVGAKNESANAGWADTEQRMGTGVPPPGVPVWWTGGNWGHVALSDGGGNAWSNDFNRRGMIDRVRIDDITRGWGYDYKGWTRDINDVQVYARGGSVKDRDKRRPQGMTREEIRKFPQNLGYNSGGMVPAFFNAGGLAQIPGQAISSEYGLASVPASIQNRSSDSSMHFGDINITNPRPEPASDSIPRSIRKLSYLGQG